MPAFGGYSPFPLRFGGGTPRLRLIHESLNAQRGTAFDTSDRTKIVWLENMAIARAINAAWMQNQRLANQGDPKRVTDMMERWEAILDISPPYGSEDSDRRAAIEAKRALIGRALIYPWIHTLLETKLGDYFVALEFIDLSIAHVTKPSGAYPWSGTISTAYPWTSTVAHILVRMTTPSTGTEAEFYKMAGICMDVLDQELPAWVTFDWYRAPEVGAPIAVTGGPSAAGFYLDERNLDNSVFDV